ncbi:MAG: glycosyltransferase family 4 protein [Acidobacteriota bacterium]|nr:glycosyltransferase family 4 protein [Acidobacteriota bacterium]
MEENGAPLRIAQLITGSECIGGAQTHVRDLTAGLRSRGHHCTVLAGHPDGLFCEQLRDSGVGVRVLPSLRKPLHVIRDGRAFAEILRELTRLQPDLVAVHTAKASFLGRLAAATLRLPCVFTPHGFSIIDRKSGKTNRLFTVLERLAGQFGSKAITVSEHEWRLAADSGVIHPRNLTMVHNGIPDSALIADPAGEPVVITMVARFDPPKDQATLLRALAQLTPYQWTLRLVGSGTLLKNSMELAAALGIKDRVEFLGESPEIPKLLAGSQIFVLASKLEAFPISILEAMRAGLPVIASRVGGIPEAVKEGETGFLVPPLDHHALAERLSLLLQSQAARTLLGGNARRRYLAHFTADAMVVKTLAVYSSALTSSRVPALHTTKRSAASTSETAICEP